MEKRKKKVSQSTEVDPEIIGWWNRETNTLKY